ncbi:hypothetical protein VP01_1818g3 [Puccinia sorghi]|uniref:Uncharacterized protein n=1 Tax=Puccinia sorghi TaxID=27349 RepID=A0A0L6VE55_9BASI|nr:hypothetical protein VP01_1818g3 [Puccinia sorghi]
MCIFAEWWARAVGVSRRCCGRRIPRAGESDWTGKKKRGQDGRWMKRKRQGISTVIQKTDSDDTLHQRVGDEEAQHPALLLHDGCHPYFPGTPWDQLELAPTVIVPSPPPNPIKSRPRHISPLFFYPPSSSPKSVP